MFSSIPDNPVKVAFSNKPLNSSNTNHSPFDKKQDYANTMQIPSYTSSADDDDGAVVNPLLNVEDFGQYLDADGDDDMWADLVKQKFN